MRKDSAPEQLRQDLTRLFDSIRGDLDRVELISAALGAFNRPVPDYEPRFVHLQHALVNVRELRG